MEGVAHAVEGDSGGSKRKRHRGGRRGGSKHKLKQLKGRGGGVDGDKGGSRGGSSKGGGSDRRPGDSRGAPGNQTSRSQSSHKGSDAPPFKQRSPTKGYKPKAKTDPLIVAANNEISQHAQRKQLAEASARFEALGEFKNSHSYAAIVNAHVRCGDVAGAAERVLAMKSGGLKPCVVTYTSLIKGYCAEGRLGEAEAVLRDMEAAKPKVRAAYHLHH